MLARQEGQEPRKTSRQQHCFLWSEKSSYTHTGVQSGNEKAVKLACTGAPGVSQPAGRLWMLGSSRGLGVYGRGRVLRRAVPLPRPTPTVCLHLLCSCVCSEQLIGHALCSVEETGTLTSHLSLLTIVPGHPQASPPCPHTAGQYKDWECVWGRAEGHRAGRGGASFLGC